MKYALINELGEEELKLVNVAFEAAEKSYTDKNHRVGCAIIDNSGHIFLGAINSRTRAIGSTCAERMALDQLYFSSKLPPKLCVVTGNFDRLGWKEDYICTPCGVCLEMFYEALIDFKLKDLDFVCCSWNKSSFLKVQLSQLYPQFGKGVWRRQ